jgi:hypothetical protein
MLRDRTFDVVVVSPDHPVGSGQPDRDVRHVQYDGHQVRVQF